MALFGGHGRHFFTQQKSLNFRFYFFFFFFFGWKTNLQLVSQRSNMLMAGGLFRWISWGVSRGYELMLMVLINADGFNKDIST